MRRFVFICDYKGITHNQEMEEGFNLDRVVEDANGEFPAGRILFFEELLSQSVIWGRLFPNDRNGIC